MGITNIEYIKEIARLLNDTGLTKIVVSEADAKIILEKSGGISETNKIAPRSPVNGNISANPEGIIDFNAMIEIKSPIVGVFYAAPSPETEPFVRLGDHVKKGDVLCIIEAMKLLNEITAEQDGKIVDIGVSNGDVVEFGQVLFKMT